MSSYFDEASLVMIPSGYKTSKLYSIKPTDGSGDMSFSRSNDTATRVNSAGLIEKVRTNLLTYSNDFSNAAWVALNTPILTSNYATNPLTGENNAWRFQADNDNDRIYQTYSGSFLNFSIYAKGSGTLRLRDNVGVFTDVTLTANWQRVSIHFSGSISNVQITTGTSCDATIYAAQLETGDIATPYIATTSAAVSVGPVANVPRLDYLNSSCPRLLLEPQRTNLFTYSEQFDNAAWGKVSATITANTTISPDGYQNADTFTTTGGGARIFEGLSLSAGTYTASLYVKKLSGSGNMRFFGIVDGSGVTRSFTPTDTWQRFTGNFTASTGITEMQLREDGFTGTLAIYGFQLEAGAYATSYIPTLGAAVTRGADAASKTGISSLIGQTEGTLFVEVNFNGSGFGTDNDFLVYVGNGSNTNSMYIDYYNNLFRFVIFTGASLTFYDDVATTSGTHKLALAYKSGSYAAYLDGVQIKIDTSAANPPTTSVFSLAGGATGFNATTKNINQALIFKTRLTNAQLAELTTL